MAQRRTLGSGPCATSYTALVIGRRTGSSGPPVIKLYGERNTGTNYVGSLLRANTACELLPGTVPPTFNRIRRRVTDSDAVIDLWFAATGYRNLGWKHRRVDVDELRRRRVTGRVHFVVTTKNPYSWLVSLQRRPYHRRGGAGDVSIRALATEPWRTRRCETGPDVYDNAVRMWNDKAAAYLELAEALPTTVVRYEDLVADPSSEVARIVAETGLRLLDDRVWNVERGTKRDGRSYAEYREYYGEERWRDVLTRQDIEAINASLDPVVASAHGYRLLAPEAAGARGH